MQGKVEFKAPQALQGNRRHLTMAPMPAIRLRASKGCPYTDRGEM